MNSDRNLSIQVACELGVCYPTLKAIIWILANPDNEVSLISEIPISGFIPISEFPISEFSLDIGVPEIENSSDIGQTLSDVEYPDIKL